MVMHARKYPRLNDGYYERGQGHSYEEKAPSKSRSSKYIDPKDSPSSGSYSRHRDEDTSPSRPSPRYHNKSSYSEREKDRVSRVSSDSPSDKRANHRASSSKNGKGRDHRGGSAGDNLFKSEIQKSAIQVCGDWSEHRSHSGKKYYYNCKTEVSQWEPPKEWVDSSKSESSRKDREKSGSKAYVDGSYRSHKHSSSNQDSKYSHSSRNTPYSTPESKLSRQSSVPSSGHKSWATPGNHEHREHHRDHQSTSSYSGITRTTSTPSYSRTNSTNRLSPERGGGSGYDYKHSKHTPSSTRNSASMANSSHRDHRERSSSGSMLQALSRSALHEHDGAAAGDDMDISPGSTPTEESMSEKLHPSTSGASNQPMYTPSSSSAAGAASSSQLAAAAAAAVAGAAGSASSVGAMSGLISQLSGTDGAASGLQRLSSATITHQAYAYYRYYQYQLEQQQYLLTGQRQRPRTWNTYEKQQAAIATLQKLQEALSAHQRQKQQQLAQLLQQQQQAQTSSTSTTTTTSVNTCSDSTAAHDLPQPQHNGSQSPESDGTPLQSPEPNVSSASLNQSNSLNVDTVKITSSTAPTTDTTQVTATSTSVLTCASPSLSSQSSQLANAVKKPDNIELPPSLANYYEDALIGHVSSWMEEGRSLERAADRFSEDAHNIGALGSTQVSVDMKKARSWVRGCEIQSTLQEQRILFLRQQIKELEGMRSQNTFMPGAT